MRQLEPLMMMVGVQPSIIPTVSGYLYALSWGVFPLYMLLMLSSVNEGLFSTKALMYISLMAIPINIALNYIFMYGYFGIPAMGAVGLGYATAIVWTLTFIALFLYTVFSKKYQHITFFKHFHKPDIQVFKEILTVGIPLSFTIGLEVLMFGAVGLFIGRYSVEIIAAHQIALNFISIIFMVPLGLSIAVTARVGHAVGRNSNSGIKLATYIGLIFSVIVTFFAMLVTFSLPAQIISVYTTELDVLKNAVPLLYMAAIFMMFDGIQVTTSGALRGMKDTFVPMILSGISYWLIGFPVGYYLAQTMNMQAQGYWIGFIAGLSTAAVLLSIRLRVLLRKRAII